MKETEMEIRILHNAGHIDLHIDIIDSKMSISIGWILAWWDQYFYLQFLFYV